MKGFPQVGYLKNFISSENIIVGDYTYYDDPGGPERFESNVLYHFPFIGDNSVVGGNPATVIKQRFDECTINDLLSIAWWDWSAEKITDNLEAIVGCDLSALKEANGV